MDLWSFWHTFWLVWPIKSIYMKSPPYCRYQTVICLITNLAFGETLFSLMEGMGEIHSNSSGIEAPVWSIVAEEALGAGLHSTRGEKWVVAMETPNMPFAEEHEMCIADTLLLAGSSQTCPKLSGTLKYTFCHKPKMSILCKSSNKFCKIYLMIWAQFPKSIMNIVCPVRFWANSNLWTPWTLNSHLTRMTCSYAYTSVIKPYSICLTCNKGYS